jgi:hypothetical protein
MSRIVTLVFRERLQKEMEFSTGTGLGNHRELAVAHVFSLTTTRQYSFRWFCIASRNDKHGGPKELNVSYRSMPED